MSTPVSNIKINRHIRSKRIDIKDNKKDLSKFFGIASPTTKYATKKETKPAIASAPEKVSNLFLGIADNDDMLFPIELEVLNEPNK